MDDPTKIYDTNDRKNNHLLHANVALHASFDLVNENRRNVVNGRLIFLKHYMDIFQYEFAYLDLRQSSPHRHHNIQQTCNQSKLSSMVVLLS